MHYVPDAVCYHEHSSTTRAFPPEMVRVLQARNPLLTCFKNYDDANLARVLPALLATAVRRMWIMARIGDVSSYRLEHPGARQRSWLRRFVDGLRTAYGHHRIGKLGVSDLIAMNDWLGNWPHWEQRRAEVQAGRRRPDAEIFELFLKPFWCVENDPGYVELQESLVKHVGLDELFDGWTYEGSDPHD